MTDPLLDIRDLKVHFRIGKNWPFGSGVKTLKAVDGIDLAIDMGEVVSLVGESGCGKSTVGRALTRLEDATDGEVRFKGKNVLDLDRNGFRPLRADIQMIFQDPFASLNPRLTIEQTLAEPLRIHGLAHSAREAREKIAKVLQQVGLDPSVMTRHPHAFSGGQRQRIGIARVMILSPKLVIADEPVSALDVSIQAQVLNLIRDLQRETGVAMLFISHDLGVVRHISDRIAVMYLGRIVETGPKSEIFANPTHPYTRLLLRSIPRPVPNAQRKRLGATGEPASATNPPPGCAFHPRCPLATEVCRTKTPPRIDLGQGHIAACHHTDQREAAPAA
ncbi:ABC transporter ATP-binding protein [Cucumibacter marinus]|uniref:ABC transporter ATP-binding protein n=1 Tax=Cucumibacter marinus TaxID=1121252 RepID=UPI00040C7F0C|nr:oligopeptide/dipeptide ABC transporter ATP-binding protein [Cucumibacter marinus]